MVISSKKRGSQWKQLSDILGTMNACLAAVYCTFFFLQVELGSSRAFCKRYCSKDSDLQHKFSFDREHIRNGGYKEENALFTPF